MPEPDQSFMRDLKALDRRLDCMFNTSIDLFVIYYERAHGGKVPIFKVADEDGEFRQPDKRDIEYLKSGDLECETVNEKCTKAAKYIEESRRKSMADAKDNIRNMTKDDKIQWSQLLTRMAGTGKGNSAFRRVDLKPSAFTVTDNRIFKEDVGIDWTPIRKNVVPDKEFTVTDNRKIQQGE